MQYFIDGSMLKLLTGYRGIGWAIKEGSEASKEYSGFFFTRNERLSCELVALVMLVSKIPRPDWGITSVYTDSDEVRQPLAFLVSDLSRNKSKESFSAQVLWAVREVKKAYPDVNVSVEDVLSFLETVRVNKLKSHSGLVENDRVDYLARNDMYIYLQQSPFYRNLRHVPNKLILSTQPYRTWLKAQRPPFKHLLSGVC